MAKPVRFTTYARGKFVFLRDHGFRLNEQDVIQTLLEPDRRSPAQRGRWVAQRKLSERHVLRVIYEARPHELLVITFYPARRSRYEPTHEV